jgi:hypothetical protein
VVLPYVDAGGIGTDPGTPETFADVIEDRNEQRFDELLFFIPTC